MFATLLTPEAVANLLRSPELSEELRVLLGPEPIVRSLPGRTLVFEVTGSAGEFVLRFPSDEQALASLTREARLLAGLRGFVTLAIPDTRVYRPGGDLPAFALHSMVMGKDWFHLSPDSVTSEARSSMAADLTRFLRETHAVPLRTACGWLQVSFDGKSARQEPANQRGKPDWFDSRVIANVRQWLLQDPLSDLETVFERIVEAYRGLEPSAEDLVFGHGDLHGGNLAFLDDGGSPRLVGIFDFGNADVLDVHYDFARLNLLDDDLQDRVIDEYRALAPARRLDRRRVEVYTLAFVFYLLGEQLGSDGSIRPDRQAYAGHLVRLLRRHVEHYRAAGHPPL